jgi:hypothetical protein
MEALADLERYHKANWETPEPAKLNQDTLDRFAQRVHELVEDVGEVSLLADANGEDTPAAYRISDALAALRTAYELLAVGKVLGGIKT